MDQAPRPPRGRGPGDEATLGVARGRCRRSARRARYALGYRPLDITQSRPRCYACHMAQGTAAAPRFHVRWEERSSNSTPSITLARRVRGQTVQRVVAPRGRLTLPEAAAVLERPLREVRRSIRTGFLRACADGRHVTVAACHQFLRGEREDGEAAMAAMDKVRRGEARVTPWEQVRRELGRD